MLAAVLAAIVLGLVGLRDRRPRLFQYLPVPFWCYVLPMIGGTFRLFPEASPVYTLLGRYALPFCLSLLLINVDLRALVRLGRPAVLAMGLGVAGIGMGAVLGLFLFHGNLPPGAWKAVGALSASWTGGSANMLAVKEALSAPEAVFAPVVVIDSFFAYAWMAGLISLAGFQESFDRWVGAGTVGAPPPAGRGPTYHVPWPGVPAAAAVLALVALGLPALLGDQSQLVYHHALGRGPRDVGQELGERPAHARELGVHRRSPVQLHALRLRLGKLLGLVVEHSQAGLCEPKGREHQQRE